MTNPYPWDPFLPTMRHVPQGTAVFHGDATCSRKQVAVRLVDDHQIGHLDNASFHAWQKDE